MTKKQYKIILAVALVILGVGLWIGSWKQKIQLTERNLNAALQSMATMLDRRHQAMRDVAETYVVDAPANQQLTTLANYLHDVQLNFPQTTILTDRNVYQQMMEQEQQLTKITYELFQYGQQKTSIKDDRASYKKIKNLYYINLQLYNTQKVLNEEIAYFNAQVSGAFKGTLNQLTFRYKPKIVFGEILTQDIEQYHKVILGSLPAIPAKQRARSTR